MSTAAAILTRRVDLRTAAPQDRPVLLLSAFDALAPGDGILLTSEEDPAPLLDALRAGRKGMFEWAPLQVDPSAWQVEITRRRSPPSPVRRVTEALAWDHQRLDALETRAFACLTKGDRETAQGLYGAFQRGLTRHIHLEEALLFPVFERKTGLSVAGPTAVLRSEHREIRMVLEAMGRSLAGGAGGMEELRRDLQKVLVEHDRKEETLLYPAIDQLLTPEESDALVARIQAFPL